MDEKKGNYGKTPPTKVAPKTEDSHIEENSKVKNTWEMEVEKEEEDEEIKQTNIAE